MVVTERTNVLVVNESPREGSRFMGNGTHQSLKGQSWRELGMGRDGRIVPGHPSGETRG